MTDGDLEDLLEEQSVPNQGVHRREMTRNIRSGWSSTLANNHPVNAIRIAWAEPYARHYLVQYWTGEEPIKQPTKGNWVTFPGGSVATAAGGIATLRLTASPMPVRFLRILMTRVFEYLRQPRLRRSAQLRRVCDQRTLSWAPLLPDGKFHDLVRHTADPTKPQPIALPSIPGTTPADIDDKGIRSDSTSSTPAATRVGCRR